MYMVSLHMLCDFYLDVHSSQIVMPINDFWWKIRLTVSYSLFLFTSVELSVFVEFLNGMSNQDECVSMLFCGVTLKKKIRNK